MATLQAAKPIPTPAHKSRPKPATRAALPQPAVLPKLAAQSVAAQSVAETFEALSASASTTHSSASAASTSYARPYHERLSEIEQRQLLLQTIKVYGGWELASIQHRPESDMLIAYLVRSRDNEDAALAVREGRAMQIMMDAMGDLRIKRPRRQPRSLFAHLTYWLSGLLGRSEFGIPA